MNGQEPLRIAMFGQKRIPSCEGGIEVVVEELSVRMAAAGHKVTCYNRGGHHVSGAQYDRGELREYKGVRLRKVPTIDRKGLAAVSSSFFSAFSTAFGRYDIVHIHAEGPAFMCWLPKLLGKHVIVTVHGLDHKRAKWGKFAGMYILGGEKNAVRFADEIIVLSRDVQKYFRDEYGRETVYIPNGTERREKLPPELISEKWGLEKDGYILFLGRIVPEKGIHYLIRAFRDTKTDKKLIIAGGSSDTDGYSASLREFAAGDERIIFTGFVEGQAKNELYSNAYIYVLPSDLEGMPLSLLEAMSYGNCCLTSDIPECTEVTEDKAVSFRKGDEKDLARTLERLCGDPEEVGRYKSGAAEHICGKYNWDETVKKTLLLYGCDPLRGE